MVASWTARPTENYFYGCVYTALWAFGGGIIVPLLVGHNDYYPFPLKDEYAVPILILAYSIHRWFGLIRNLISVRPIRVLLLCTFECARCYMALNWLNVAAKTIPASRFNVPIVGPLICGTIASCGGPILMNGMHFFKHGLSYAILTGFSVMCLYLGTVYVAPIYNPLYKLTEKQAHGVCAVLLISLRLAMHFTASSQQSQKLRKTWQSKLIKKNV